MASRYNHVEYDSEEERGNNPTGPPTENLISAAGFIASLFQSRGIAYGLMGGFALTCCGSRRVTHDIDIAHEATMAIEWELVEPESRLIIPQSRLIADIMRIFVRTGPEYDQCAARHDVEVDLMRQGSYGSPRHLRHHLQIVNVTTSRAENVAFNALDVYFLLKSKLGSCTERGLERDFIDMRFILEKWPAQASECRSMLDPEAIAAFGEKLRPESKIGWASPIGSFPDNF